MKPQKIKKSEAQVIDIGSKKIHAYPLDTRALSVAYMKVNGRNPKDTNSFLLEHDCQFIIFVTKGKGTVYAGENIYQVNIGDVIYVPTNTKFAVDGDMEYVTVDTPGFYPEQSEEILQK